MKMQKSLTALAVGTFALGIAEFAMMGILGDVARSMNVSIVSAGHFISAYSAGVAIGAPALIFLRKLPLRRLMLLLAALIALGNAAAAIAPDYWSLLGARFVSGLPHGAFFGAGAIVCSRLSAPGYGARAVALMVGGMTVANLVGVPGATFVSNLVSWRLAFAIVSLFGMLAFAGIRMWIPVMPSLPDTGLKGQFRFLRSAAPWLIYAGVFFGQAGVYCYFSYVEPIMTEVACFSSSAMTMVMVLAGAGMVAGNIAAGRLADRYNPMLVTGCIAALTALLMPAVYVCAPYKLPSLALMVVATGCLFGLGGPLQYLIVKFSKGGEMLGGAGIQIAFNVSNAMSAVIGGIVIQHGCGLASPALAGTPFAIIGATALFVLYRRYHTTKL